MSTLLKITGSNQGRERNKHDFYPTPDYATEALLEREKFTDVWEPACGDGAISKVLIKNRIKTISTDLVDYGYGDVSGEFQSGGVMAFAWFVFKQEKDNSQWLSRVSWI